MRFRPAVDLAGRCVEAFGEELELLNHRFQVGEHAVLGRQGDTGDIGHDRALVRNLVQALANDLHALVHFLNADPVPIVGVPVFPHGDAELALRVGAVGLVLAEIVIHARAAEGGTTETEAHGVLGRNHGHALGTGQPNAILFQEDDVLIDLGREVIHELSKLRQQRRRKIPLHAADAIPTGRQAGPAQLVEPIQQNLPVAERVKEHGHGPDIQGLGPEPKLVSDDALDLSHDGAQVLGPFRHREVHEFLDRPAIGEVVIHRADVIQTVGVRDELVIGAVLGQLLDPPVEVAHDGSGLDDPLSLQLEDDLQDAMGAGMLRTHVEEQFLGPQGGQGRAFRVLRIDLVHGGALIVELMHHSVLSTQSWRD